MDSQKEGYSDPQSSSQCGLYMEAVTQKMKYIQEIYAEKWKQNNVQRTGKWWKLEETWGFGGRVPFNAIIEQLFPSTHVHRTLQQK